MVTSVSEEMLAHFSKTQAVFLHLYCLPHENNSMLLLLRHPAAVGTSGLCPQRGQSESSSGAWHTAAVRLQRPKHDTATGPLEITPSRHFSGSTQYFQLIFMDEQPGMHYV